MQRTLPCASRYAVLSSYKNKVSVKPSISMETILHVHTCCSSSATKRLGRFASGQPAREPSSSGLQSFGIAILREYRKQGLGKLLVRCALALAEGQVYIHAQVQSEGFYQRLGFVAEDQTIFYEADIPHRTMIWPHGKGVLPCTITRPS